MYKSQGPNLAQIKIFSTFDESYSYLPSNIRGHKLKSLTQPASIQANGSQKNQYESNSLCLELSLELNFPQIKVEISSLTQKSLQDKRRRSHLLLWRFSDHFTWSMKQKQGKRTMDPNTNRSNWCYLSIIRTLRKKLIQF